MTSSGAVTGTGRRYLILAIIFVNLAVIYGVWYSYSVFLVALLREFHWSRAGRTRRRKEMTNSQWPIQEDAFVIGDWSLAIGHSRARAH